MDNVETRLAQVLSLCPSAKAINRLALSTAYALPALEAAQINTDQRFDHFFAQVLHESGALQFNEENLNYSAQALVATWPNRFPNLALAARSARQPELIANAVYGGRMGNTQPGDGWKYHGRGLIQLTGRDMYTRVGQALDDDFEATPELVNDPHYCLATAAALWGIKGCNVLADADDIESITKHINGGLNGFDDRKAWLAKLRQAEGV